MMAIVAAAVLAVTTEGTAAPEPAALVKAMRELYSTCRSYRDKGVVEIDYLNEDGTRRGGGRRPFSTAFVRPDRFRFEFKDEADGYGDLYVIWADGVLVRSWWTNRPQVESWPSVGAAVGAATGVSGGAAHLMANLLLPSVGGVGPDSLSGVRIVGEDAVAGVPCWRLEGRGWLSIMGESPMSFWIAKGTPHLLRVSFVFDIPGAKSRTTITVRPEINVDLAETTFAFTPPGK